ncbi:MULTISPECIES: spore coat U domain-containing protein [Caballeronia]|jgi:spore coat protein U-like protein|uniref:Signal peptide protein n=1 Tax=Caballeronia zhejiangensis TaxID=871203 RepID=A0A656QEV8_9BURK|nr:MULTISPECIES: spore coat U domain-containing protein [Caballeronia]EKS68482.1 lipoprotein signal peptide [Burkholderia sp. SJ98]KDR28243.1 signal peptide protein [Caballeronia zhejiangensis]MDR5764438.1 spore coat U domain-containing protein [Caballeronia sp. LZ028]
MRTRSWIRRGAVIVVAMFALLALPKASRAQMCSFSVGYTDFGEYDTTYSEPTEVVGAVIMYCTGYTTPMVRMCLNISTTSPRVLTGPNGATLDYNLYVDPDHVSVWGSILNPSTTPYIIDLPVHPSGKVWAQEPFYGRIPPNQQVGLGTYTQTFTAADTYFVYVGYSGTPPSCSTATAPYKSAAFNVSVNVANNCNISATPMAFGTQSSFQEPLEATSRITATCTSGASYNIALNGGTSDGGAITGRKLTRVGGTETIDYQLYIDPSHTVPWGDGTSGTVMGNGVGTGVAYTFTVYGQVPAQSAPRPGPYRDTITAFIIF